MKRNKLEIFNFNKKFSKKTKILFIFTAFLIIFTVFSISFSNVSTQNNKINVSAVGCSAKSMCVLEKDSKRIIYSQNENLKLPMASTTKVMTAITVIQNCDDLKKVITVDDKAIGVEGTSIYLRKDEEIAIIDLLYGLMLRSGNDAATALAIELAGSVNKFAELMNELANKIGAKNSHFTNPHGLDDKNHYTTAYDLALITSYALNNPIFSEIVSTKSHIIEATNKSDKRYLSNKNKLLSTLEGCCGVKTGFTSKAGRCLVSSAKRDNTTYVCVVLNCGPMFEESARLLNLCFENYKNEKLIDRNKEIFNEYIIDKQHGRLYLYAEDDFYYPLTESEKENITFEYNVKLDDAEINENVGEIKVFLNKHLIKTLKLFTMNKIDKLIDSKTLSIQEILWEERINEN